MSAAVPSVEIGDDTDTLCGGGPDGKVHTGDSIHRFDVGAEFFVRIVVAAFGHQVQIEIAELIGKRIWVVDLERDAFMRAPLNFVAAGLWSGSLAGWPSRFEEAFRTKF